MKKQVEKWTLKQIVFVLFMMVMGSRLVGQTILFDVKTYNSGYNVSCHGYTDGSIQVTVVEGTYPFTYSWNTGATTPNLNNVGAGVYTLTVTDANAVVVSKMVELKEPDGFDAVLHPSLVQGGYNISSMGGHDGKIATEITGGTPPYTYAWSNNATSSYIENLGAGTYTVTINDQNTCAVTRTQVLTAPSLLHIVSITASNQNGHSVSCFGKANGSITTVVSGGVPPYTYAWDNGSFDQNPSGLKAGLYKLSVKDANNSTASGQITLTEPTELAVTLTRSNFGGYTISCNSCANGTINTSVAGGTSPFTYLWDGGQTNANRHNLGVGSYSVTVTDANGCQTTGDATMTEPANAGWDFAGNAVDSSKFIGSSNNAPLIFKTNNAERMRISESGNVTINNNATVNGTLTTGNLNISNAFTSTAIHTGRITGLPGDSIIHLGDSSLVINYPSNNIHSDGLGSHHGVGLGLYCWGVGNNSLALGGYRATANGTNSIAMGYGVDANVDKSIVIGSGYGLGNNSRLINTKQNSLMIGFNSNVPTLFVSPADGTPGGLGKIGIGTTTPSEILEVNGNLKVVGNSITNGNAGVGTSTPQDRFQIGNAATKIVFGSAEGADLGWGEYYIGFNAARQNSSTWSTGNDGSHNGGVIIYSNVVGDLFFSNIQNTGAGDQSNITDATIKNNIAMRILRNGSVGIGTDFVTNYNTWTDYKLAVNGGVRCKFLKVEPNWSDFVFEKTYKLRTLKEVEQFIIENGHLPEIPSSKEVGADGIDVGEMNAKLLQKIEELTLYTIELQKQIDKLKNN